MGRILNGVVDCRVDRKLENEFLTLNLWGKPLFVHVVEEVLKCKEIAGVSILTESEYIKKLTNDWFKDADIPFISSVASCPGVPQVVVSGRAPFLKGKTLDSVVKCYSGGVLHAAVEEVQFKYSACGVEVIHAETMRESMAFIIYDGLEVGNSSLYRLDNTEGFIINTKNDFELALVLKKKELKVSILVDAIMARIEEKKTVLRKGLTEGICLVGHSQIDNWEIRDLCGFPVRNCGISGISSFEYNECILEKELLDCKENCYIVMHGTNDIVYRYSFLDVAMSIMKTVNYIRTRKREAIIYFLSCIAVNGRLDRDNRTIRELNIFLKGKLEGVIWIGVEALNDDFGNLNPRYTKDGLHLSNEGYNALKRIVEEEVRKGCYGENSGDSGSFRIEGLER